MSQDPNHGGNNNNNKEKKRKSRKRSKLSSMKTPPKRAGFQRSFDYSPSSPSSRGPIKKKAISKLGNKIAKVVKKGKKVKDFMYSDWYQMILLFFFSLSCVVF